MNNIFKSYSFGFEIETPNEDYGTILDLFTEFKNKNGIVSNWVFKADFSLKNKDDKVIIGGELASPIIIESLNEEEIAKVFGFFDFFDLKANENGNSHLHVGAHIFKRNLEFYKRLTLFFMAFENILYKLLNSDVPKPNIDEYTRLIYMELWNKIPDIISFEGSLVEFINLFFPRRERNLNLRNLVENPSLPTIELRGIKSTFDIEHWKKVLNIVYHSCEYIKSDEFNQEYVISRILANNEKRLFESNEKYIGDINESDIDEFLNLIGLEELMDKKNSRL